MPLPVYARLIGETKQIVNGEVVQDTVIKSEYNGRITHYNIKDNALKKLLASPTSNMNLIERLKLDYGHTHGKHTKHTKHTKHKHTKHGKHGKHKHGKHKHGKHTKRI